MSQFNTTYQGCKVIVNFAGATDPFESLEGVEIYYASNGDEIDYDDIGTSDWLALHEQVKSEFAAHQADSADFYSWG